VKPGDPDAPHVQVPEEVRRFYERMPYPAPFTTLEEHRELYRNPDRRRAQFHLLWPADRLQQKQEILVAGCGTSQAARYALREPESRVTAIDISATSLRYTRDLQQKYHLGNLELQQLALEDVRDLGRTFDQIVCTGVLHHLPDPDVGLAALRDVLRPQGAMQLMVYAPYGRAGIYMLQEYCRVLGVAATPEDLRDLDSVLDALPDDHPLAAVMHNAKDFRHPEALADALLHPLDRAYSVPQLYAWLERCGLSLARWMQQAPYLPQCGAVAKTRHAQRLAALPEPAQHAALELLRGTMVRHSLIAYRADRVGERQPIRFDERCLGYVPIRVPWTVTVRERLPPGCVAVLINRAHAFTDLVLTVDSLEDRLLAHIDGRRSVAAILGLAGVAAADRRGVAFFERLWQYDQVVFDASEAPVVPGKHCQ
jgi:SAM-dependent methyltransferase